MDSDQLAFEPCGHASTNPATTSPAQTANCKNSSSVEGAAQASQSPASGDNCNRDAMTDPNSSFESESSAEETTSAAVHSVTSACETMLWEGWSHAACTSDDASTSALHLPELAPPSSSRLACQNSDMLSNLLSTFHPLSHQSSPLHLPPEVDNCKLPPGFLQEPPGLALEPDEPFFMYTRPLPKENIYNLGTNNNHHHHHNIPCPIPGNAAASNSRPPTPFQLWQQPLGLPSTPSSPSSPLALHHGLRHSQSDKSWEGGSSPWAWPGATSRLPEEDQGMQAKSSATDPSQTVSRAINAQFFGASGVQNSLPHPQEVLSFGHKAGPVILPNGATHSEMFLSPNGSFLPMPATWPAPEFAMPGSGATTTRSQQFMNFVRIAQEQRPVESNSDSGRRYGEPYEGVNKGAGDGGGEHLEVQTRAGKPLHTLLRIGGQHFNLGPDLKRPAASYGARGEAWRSPGARRGGEHARASGAAAAPVASQAMEVYALGPALNTNGKPRARRGSATDPQSVYARHRREKINERFKILQHLVPNGAKVDIVTMLDEAIQYVRFLQHQVMLLKSEDHWMLATPDAYKGIDLSNPCTQMQGLQSNA